jgi:nucleotide-binding universal stress UspA family protein
MIPNINKILYATDLSDNSAYAFRYAMNSALKHDAAIIILHVFEIASMTSRAAMDLYLDEDFRNRIYTERMADTIDRIRKRLKIS